MSGILGTNLLTQVGFIVKDLESAKLKFAQFFGVEPPPTCDGGEFAVTGTTYMGRPAPDANCYMAFFNVGDHTQIELIQPNGVKSVWQDFLDEHGEGVHHLAFGVKDTDGKIAACEDFGMQFLQRGKYGDGSGQYTYMDATDSLKCYIELLESF